MAEHRLEPTAETVIDVFCRDLPPVLTWKVTKPLLEAAGVSTDESLDWDQIKPVLDRLNAAGRVPLVHAHEWNLTPSGPLKLDDQPPPGAVGSAAD